MDGKSLVQEWLDLHEWEGVIVEGEDEGEISMRMGISLDGYTWDLFIDANDETCNVGFFLYSPFKVKESKRIEACVLANELNDRMRFGRFVLREDGRLQYRHQIDFETTEPTCKSLELIAMPAFTACETYSSALAAVALTKQKAVDAIAELDAAQAENQVLKKLGETDDDAGEAPKMM